MGWYGFTAELLTKLYEGTKVETNGKVLMAEKEPRIVAKWAGVIQQLLKMD